MGSARSAAGRTAIVIGALLAALALPAGSPAATSYPEPPTTFEPLLEAENFAITQERQTIYDTPEYQAQLAADSAKSATEALAAQAGDPGRYFTNNLCWNRGNGCAGDIRLNGWAANGDGISGRCCSRRATARRCRAASGRRRTAPKRQAPASSSRTARCRPTNRCTGMRHRRSRRTATSCSRSTRRARARATRSARRRRTRGRAGTDRWPALLRRHRGRDRLLPVERQAPLRAGAQLRNRHEPRGQAGRTREAGLRRRLQPLLEDAQSEGAGAGRALLRRCRRLLHRPMGSARRCRRRARTTSAAPARKPARCRARRASPQTIGEKGCPANPADRTTVPITKPGLGMSADYGLPPTPNTSLPEPAGQVDRVARLQQGRSRQRRDHHPRRLAPGLQLHPNQAFGASLRGPDLVAWYTSAWFDKYVKRTGRLPTSACSPTAGAKTPMRKRSIRTTTATPSPSTTSRDSTSIATTAKSGTARTCAPAVPA